MLKDNSIAMYMMHCHYEAYDPYNDEVIQLKDIDHGIPYQGDSLCLVMTINNRIENDMKTLKMEIPSYWELKGGCTIEIIKAKEGGEIEWKKRNG